MIPLSQNCRGLGNPWLVRALHVMVQRWKPDIVFLMETKSKVKHVERIKNRVGFANGLIVPSQGRSGGVAHFWTRASTPLLGRQITLQCGESLASMATQKLIKGTNLGAFSPFYIVSSNSLGYAQGILMKYFQCMKKLGALSGHSNKWMALEIL